MTDEIKVEVPKEPKAGKAKGVSRKEFEELETKINTGFSTIMEKLEGLNKQSTLTVTPAVNNTAVPTKEDNGAPRNDLTPVPPTWREMVDKILGPDFDCEFYQPPQGGQKFSIIVPKEKSNADQQHWKYFSRDKRTKELSNTGITGVEEWCKKVRANLIASGKTLVQYP